jgi:hypothetical protein
MSIVLNGTTGITNDGGYTGDGVVFADTTPANTLVTTTGGNVGIGTGSPSNLIHGRKDQSAAATYGIVQNDGAASSTTFAGWVIQDGSTVVSGIRRQRDGGASATQVGSFAGTSPLALWAGDAERARIDTSGNLLVGATVADAGSRLRVVGASSTSADYALVVDRASGADIFGCRNDGYVVVSSLSGSGNRAVYSDASGGLTNSSSDRNLKEDDREISQGLPEVLAMRPVNFKWIDEDRFGKQRELGFIAQEMQELVPEVIGENSDGSLSLDYPKLVPVLVKAIQEQQAIITALTARVEALEGKANV